jgi:eukaryotic-like serine/threonine-protein kinase
MDPERWQLQQELFLRAVELPASERASFIESACQGQPDLAAEVWALLDADQRPSPLEQENLAELAVHSLNADPEPPYGEFGPYQVQRLLGEGGMAVVYLARREDLGSVAAIKVLRDAWMSPARRDRFALEQRTLAQLSHPSIARLYDADTLPDGTPWFAMEYVSNAIPLTDYCRKYCPTLEHKLRLFRSVCEAVQYAHSRAIIHRDLKPSNILVTSDGVIKLLDFGIAKQLDSSSDPALSTVTGLRLMTPAYAAPEQIRGEQPGTYTDVYALGVILYELLTGHLPFDFSGASSAEAELAILNKEPEKPSIQGIKTLAKARWADLDVLCLKALQKDPRRRYQSAENLIRDIDHCLNSEPLEARPDTLSYRAGKFVRRNHRGLAVAALVLACLSALTLFYTVRLASAGNAALAEAARTQRILRFTLDLFNGGDLNAGPAGDLRVTTLIDRGAREAANLNRDPAVQAEMYETLGEVYQKLGLLDRADSFLTRALDQRRKLFGPRDKNVAASLVDLGLLRSNQARFVDAERFVREGLAIDGAILAPGDPEVAVATHALGLVLEDRGAYNDAANRFREAIKLRSTSSADPADLASSRLELANTYFYLGRYDEAESLYNQLLAQYAKLFGERHPMVAEDLINLGAIQQERGHYKEAEAYHRQALDIMQSFYGKEHYKTASSLTLVARALTYQNRFPEAIEMLERALAINEKVFGPVHPSVASTLNELGNIAVRERRYSDAQADFARMVEIYRSCYHGKHYLIGIALANLGGVFMARNDNAKAEQLFEQAIAMYAQTLPPNSLNEGITRIRLGRALLRENRIADAQTQTLTGYNIVSRLQSPSVSYLQNAKQDLAEEQRKLLVK